jgi:hypothetical protein
MARQWLVAAVLLLTLTGCGDEPEAEPATVPVPATSSATPVPSDPAAVASRAAAARTTAAPIPTAPKAVGEQAGSGPGGFVAAVWRTMPGLATDHREDEIATLARQACASLAGGRSARAVVAEVRTFGIDRADARALARLAIATVCPGQDGRLDEF